MAYYEPAHRIDQKRWRIAMEIEMLVLDAVIAVLENVNLDSETILDKQRKASEPIEPPF